MWLADTFLPREPDTLVFGPAEWQKTEQPGRVHLKAELALKNPEACLQQASFVVCRSFTKER